MTELQIFEYQNKQIRTVEKDGTTWWVLKDICDALNLSSPHKVAERLDEDERCGIELRTSGGLQNTTVINESGLYNVILRSDKPEAIPFRKWVTSEVLPAIRKHGAYMTPETLEAAILNPDTIIKIATALKEEKEKNQHLLKRIEEDKPMVLFAKAVETSDSSILIGDLAKLIKQNGVDIGQKRLFDWMRKNGYLIKSGSSMNMPTQMAMELGVFEVKERTISNPDGSVRITRTTKVTGKGQQYFINKFLSKDNIA